MKVALVHGFLIKLGGAERVLKSLSELYPDAPIYTLLYDEKKVGEVFPKERVRTSKLQKFPRFKGSHKLLFPQMPSAIEDFDLSEYDLVISSSSAYAHGIVTNLETTHLCYYHTPMRYAWDYTHRYLADQGLGGIGEWLASRLIHRVRQWDFLASDRVDYSIANSKNTAQRIRKFYRKEAEVIYPPVDTERFKAHDKHEGYFLIVSTLTPYKRIDLAVELFNKLGKRLVIIGDGPDRKRLQSRAAANIDFLGFKSDDVVKTYYENCRAFIFPGEDDFGIAPVEAMACGKPVLAYGKGGALETVIPGETGELFDEQNLDSMEASLTQLLINEKNYDAKKIAEHASQFSESAFKKAMKSAVERAKMGT